MADGHLLRTATDNMNASMAERWLKRSLTLQVSRTGARSAKRAGKLQAELVGVGLTAKLGWGEK